VIAALANGQPADEHLLRGGAVSLARAAGGPTQPLAVVRRDEIVVISAAEKGSPDGLHGRLEDVQQRLARAGLPLAVGVSTAVKSVSQIPDAYREAVLARGSRPGVVSLAAMTAFDYLTLKPDPTARRLIAPAIHAFVAHDAAEGGPLIATLREYVAADLNARRAAESLHIHVNTAHYRLARIAERTGCDLRRVSDLIEILIAARLAQTGGGERSSV
jgi:DNA-binding PucR family transcriptional regulator